MQRLIENKNANSKINKHKAIKAFWAFIFIIVITAQASAASDNLTAY